MTGEQTVSAGYVRSLLDFAVSRGAGRASLLDRAGIAPDRLADQDARLPFARFAALMRAAQSECADPALALHFGAESDFVEMSVVGLITRASETMAEAFDQMNRYARLVVEVDGHESGPRFAIIRRDDGVWIEDRRRNPNAFPELTESTWARFVHDVARRPDAPHYVKAVHVTHPAPSYAAVYEAVLRAPVTFESDRNALLIDEAWLDMRLGPARQYLFGVLAERADALMQRLESEKSTRGAVERHLLPLLHTGDVGMARIAALMGVSRPTLYRRLKAEGVVYEALLDDLRKRMALDYLGARKVSANEAAYLVGFSDPSAFSRAFKRWTGGRPGRRKRP